MRRIFGRRSIIILASIPVVFLCLLGGFFSWVTSEVYVANNQRLREYEQDFREIAHPTETFAVAFKRSVLPPPGNGKHCFFLVGEVRRYAGDRSEIETFYANRQVQLQFFVDNKLKKFPYSGLDQLSDWDVTQLNSNEYYLVFTLNSRIDDYYSNDLRCA
jgi:hypothetical protein